MKLKLSQLCKKIESHIRHFEKDLERDINKQQLAFDAIVKSSIEKKLSEKDFVKMKSIAEQSVFPSKELEIWQELLSNIKHIFSNTPSYGSFSEFKRDSHFFQPATPEAAVRAELDSAFKKSCALMLEYPHEVNTTMVVTGPQSAKVVNLLAHKTLKQFVHEGNGRTSHSDLHYYKKKADAGELSMDIKPSVGVEFTAITDKAATRLGNGR